MNYEIEKIKNEIRSKRKTTKIKNNYFSKYISKLLLIVILTLITLIVLKSNDKFKLDFYKNVFGTNITFASIDKWYQEKFGSSVPFKNLFKEQTVTVFNEKLKYSSLNKYKDGIKLTVSDKYLVPNINEGIVIFVGDKEGYKNTVIIEDSNGVDIWYSNVHNLNVKLYDYVKKGELIGETVNSNLILLFKENGKNVDYKKYLS